MCCGLEKMYIRINNVNESKTIEKDQTPSTYYNYKWQLAVDLFMFFDGQIYGLLVFVQTLEDITRANCAPMLVFRKIWLYFKLIKMLHIREQVTN